MILKHNQGKGDRRSIYNYNDDDVDLLDLPERDIKFNPDIFIFRSLLSAIESLKGDNLTESFAKFQILIETAESIARGAQRLSPDYNEQLADFKKSSEYLDAKESVRSQRVANKKIELLMKSISEGQAINSPLSL